MVAAPVAKSGRVYGISGVLRRTARRGPASQGERSERENRRVYVVVVHGVTDVRRCLDHLLVDSTSCDAFCRRPEPAFTISARTGWDPQGMDPGLIAEENAAFEAAGVQHMVAAPWQKDLDAWLRSMDLLVEIVRPG